MLAASRAHETFQERVNHSVQNYYIRQVPDKNDGERGTVTVHLTNLPTSFHVAA